MELQVPLISLGALCIKHWRQKELNPSGMEVVSREYRHEPQKRNVFDIRRAAQPAPAQQPPLQLQSPLSGGL